LERVLRVMTADPTAPHYGYDLMKAAKLPSGTLYPMLARLQQEGLVESEWEAQREDASGRPPRKYYRLTGDGLRVARLELAEASSAPARGAAHAPRRPARGSTQ
jgi:PadR family transcriptional regulator, regulatory protein PadR